MSRWNALVVTVVISISGLNTGCSETPPVRVYAPAVSAADFAGASALPESGYQVLDSSSTVGRFPATIGVLRLAHDGSLMPTKTPVREQGEWVETFRGIASVRDLTFLEAVTLRAYEDSLAGRCEAAARLGAGLLVIYSPLRTDINSAQVVGVVYDTKSMTAVAAVQERTRVTTLGGVEASPEEVFAEQEAIADDMDAADEPDFREYDALFPAKAAFLKHIRSAVINLAQRDTPAPRESTHQWSKNSYSSELKASDLLAER